MMKLSLALIAGVLLPLTSLGAQTSIPNPLIDFPKFLKNAAQTEVIRKEHRLTEDQFLNAISEPGVVLLDARSESAYNMRHILGAVNLSLPDFTAESLSRIIPTKGTKVLIYCNNNFLGSPAAFASKSPAASLNISTFVNLTTYGYTNVYELGPLLNVKTSKLPFEGTEVTNNKITLNKGPISW